MKGWKVAISLPIEGGVGRHLRPAQHQAGRRLTHFQTFITLSKRNTALQNFTNMTPYTKAPLHSLFKGQGQEGIIKIIGICGGY